MGQLSRIPIESRLLRNLRPPSDIHVVKHPLLDAIRRGLGPDRLLDVACVSRW